MKKLQLAGVVATTYGRPCWNPWGRESATGGRPCWNRHAPVLESTYGDAGIGAWPRLGRCKLLRPSRCSAEVGIFFFAGTSASVGVAELHPRRQNAATDDGGAFFCWSRRFFLLGPVVFLLQPSDEEPCFLLEPVIIFAGTDEIVVAIGD